jgi:molybdate transport system permease protein
VPPWYDPADLTALGLSLKVATSTTVVLLLVGTPLAWWLVRSSSRWASLVEAVVALPLVLPPTVLGFYLLCMLGPSGWLGQLARALGLPAPAFSFGGILLGSLVYSLPFVVQPLRDAFVVSGGAMLEVAATLRASPLAAFFTVVVPLARRGFLSAAILCFAHTLGEFGVVLMIGGSIPGSTQTASIAIFGHVESLQYGAAHLLSFTLVAICFVLLWIVQRSRRGTGP